MENMSKEEVIKERIRFLTEYLKILWVVLIAVSGGSVSLFLNLDSSLKAFLLLMGIVITVVASSIIGLLTLEILELFEKLKQEVEDNE